MPNIIIYFLEFFIRKKIIEVSSDNFFKIKPTGIHVYNYYLHNFFIKIILDLLYFMKN